MIAWKSFGFAALISAGAVLPGITQTAASVESNTQTVVAVAASQGNFIEEAGQIALASGAGKSVQAFARKAVSEQAQARQRLSAWTDAANPLLSGRSTAVAAEQPGPLQELTLGLTNLLRAEPAASETMVTTEGGATVTAQQRAMLEELQTKTGRDFDRGYVDAQVEAYSQIESAFANYASNGDDPALRKIAVGEAAKARRQLERLKRL